MLAKYRCLQWVFTFLFLVASSSFAGGWEQVTTLPTWRLAGPAAAVDGKIYLFGGFDHKKHVGGRGAALLTVDVYDTRTNTWHAAAEMPTPRIAPRTAVFSNQIYVFGGYDYKGRWGVKRYHKTVEVYDTQTDTWVKKPDMPTLRTPFATAVVDGKIYLIGGTRIEVNKNGVFTGKAIIGLVEVYDPLTSRWEKRADMPTTRSVSNAVVVDSKIYVLGGQARFDGDLAGRFVTRIEEYNPKTDQWHRLPDMPMFKFGFLTVAVDNEIYTMGGTNNEIRDINAVDVYNPTVNKWHQIEPLTIPNLIMAAVANGKIYTLGSIVGDFRFSPIVEAFDTGFRAVTAKGKLLTYWGELKAEYQK